MPEFSPLRLCTAPPPARVLTRVPSGVLARPQASLTASSLGLQREFQLQVSWSLVLGSVSSHIASSFPSHLENLEEQNHSSFPKNTR